jgi:hypothetical protein
MLAGLTMLNHQETARTSSVLRSRIGLGIPVNFRIKLKLSRPGASCQEVIKKLTFFISTRNLVPSPRVEAKITEISVFAGRTDDSVSLEANLANLFLTERIRTFLSELFHPIQTQSLFKLLTFFFGEDSNLPTVFEFPNSHASHIIVIRVRTPYLKFVCADQRTNQSSHCVSSNTVSTGHFGHSLFKTNHVDPLNISDNVGNF